MAAATVTASRIDERLETLADYVHRLGNVPLDRIALHPWPGTATEEDLLDYLEAENKRLFELVDGTLVEKTMGVHESVLAGFVHYYLCQYLEEADLGLLTTPDGPVRLETGRVRIPDVAFVSWKRLGMDELPKEKVLSVIPELAVEVLSESNTEEEMENKLDDYFAAGVRLVWIIDQEKESADVYTSRSRKKSLSLDDAFDGGKVLPGFSLPLKKLFARMKPPSQKRETLSQLIRYAPIPRLRVAVSQTYN